MEPKNKRNAVIAVALLLAFLVGLSAGRYVAPAKIEERIVKDVQIQKEVKIEYVERIVEKKVYVKDEKKSVNVVTRETIKPDGTVEREKIESRTTDTKVAQEQIRDQKTEAKEISRVDERRIEVAERKTNSTPNTRLSFMLGVGPQSKFLPQPLPPLVLGFGVQRRLIGPTYFGIEAFSNGTVLGTFAYEFNL
jgi:hypothetical protein